MIKVSCYLRSFTIKLLPDSDGSNLGYYSLLNCKGNNKIQLKWYKKMVELSLPGQVANLIVKGYIIVNHDSIGVLLVFFPSLFTPETFFTIGHISLNYKGK